MKVADTHTLQEGTLSLLTHSVGHPEMNIYCWGITLGMHTFASDAPDSFISPVKMGFGLFFIRFDGFA